MRCGHSSVKCVTWDVGRNHLLDGNTAVNRLHYFGILATTWVF